MEKPEFEKLRVYQIAEKLANEVWGIVQDWDALNQDTIGKQIIFSADNIGANIAAGTAQDKSDNQQLVRHAKGYLFETIHSLRLAWNRKLINATQAKKIKLIIDELSPLINTYLKSLGS